MKPHYNEKRFYNHIEEWIGAVLLAIMLTMLFIQVIMRYIFKESIPWISEYTLYMFMYFVFLSCSGAFLRNDHIQITALIDKLPRIPNRIMYILICVVNIWFAENVVYYVWLRVVDQMQMNTVSITQFPLWIMSASLLVGMALSIIRCAMNIWFIVYYDFIKKEQKEEE